jgi:hypothetical protein
MRLSKYLGKFIITMSGHYIYFFCQSKGVVVCGAAPHPGRQDVHCNSFQTLPNDVGATLGMRMESGSCVAWKSCRPTVELPVQATLRSWTCRAGR